MPSFCCTSYENGLKINVTEISPTIIFDEIINSQLFGTVFVTRVMTNHFKRRSVTSTENIAVVVPNFVKILVKTVGSKSKLLPSTVQLYCPRFVTCHVCFSCMHIQYCTVGWCGLLFSAQCSSFPFAFAFPFHFRVALHAVFYFGGFQLT